MCIHKYIHIHNFFLTVYYAKEPLFRVFIYSASNKGTKHDVRYTLVLTLPKLLKHGGNKPAAM